MRLPKLRKAWSCFLVLVPEKYGKDDKLKILAYEINGKSLLTIMIFFLHSI
jgi:hypothetical protein